MIWRGFKGHKGPHSLKVGDLNLGLSNSKPTKSPFVLVWPGAESVGSHLT